MGLLQTVKRLQLLHGCTGQSDSFRTTAIPTTGRILQVIWTGCRIPSAVKLLQIESGGHNHDIESAGAV